MHDGSRKITGYRFGVFEVDLQAGEIRKNGLKVKLQEQPFQALVILLECAPEMVAREELRKRLWNEKTFVDFDHSLSIAINRIREALGDSADNARFIETLPKRGYRFISPVERIEKDAAAKPDVLPAPRNKWVGITAVAVAAVLALAIFVFRRMSHAPPGPAGYLQLTNFPDAAFAPAISPDGRMIAFIRGDTTFPSPGQVYGKLLPNGEPVQLTKDSRPKYGLAFSPDGTQIAYTVTNPERFGWDTVTVSALGGEPRPYILNAAAMSWLDDRQVLFSQVKQGVHMGVATANSGRSDLREIYLPAHEREMAHFSYASPDHRWVLVIEGDRTGRRLPCRLVPMDGSSTGRAVGPAGECRGAGWSPDGAWMYFAASVKASSHLWRQRFPDGTPEQLTFGPAEEDGLAVWPDGRSLVSSVGIDESGIWMHDARGERPISSEGFATFPLFSADGRSVYYQLRHAAAPAENELWMTDLESGKSRPLVQGFSLDNRYDVSADGKEAVFAARAADGKLQVWLASLDQRSKPLQVTTTGGDQPFFGPDKELIFRRSEGNANYMYRMKRDGSPAIRIIPESILNIKAVSPDGKWIVVLAPTSGVASTAVVAVPIDGGAARRICPGQCTAKWTWDGKQFFIGVVVEKADSGKAVLFTLKGRDMLPPLPPAGLTATMEALKIPGSALIDRSAFQGLSQLTVSYGPDAATFAYVKTSARRNLFRIPLS